MTESRHTEPNREPEIQADQEAEAEPQPIQDLDASDDDREDVVSHALPPITPEERIAAVILVHQGSGLTREQYEETVSRLTGGQKRSMESPTDWPVEGLLVHAAGDGPSGFRVVDVWESEEACRRFGEHLEPILREVGVQAQPEMYPAYAFVSA